MKRTLWLTMTVVALAALVTIPLVAQQPQGRGMGRGMGMGMGPGGPGGRGGPGGPMAFLRGVELTDAQREQIRAIMDPMREDSPAAKVRDLDKELQLAILADSPDMQKIDELKAAIAAGTAEELSHRVEVESKIVQILTPAQRAQARENISKIGPPQGRGR
jgi:Spy/CpxP family protein refolding chaperone